MDCSPIPLKCCGETGWQEAVGASVLLLSTNWSPTHHRSPTHHIISTAPWLSKSSPHQPGCFQLPSPCHWTGFLSLPIIIADSSSIISSFATLVIPWYIHDNVPVGGLLFKGKGLPKGHQLISLEKQKLVENGQSGWITSTKWEWLANTMNQHQNHPELPRPSDVW